MKARSKPALLLAWLLLTAVIMAAAPSSDNPVDAANKLYNIGRYKEALEVYGKVKATYPDTDWAVMAQLMIARTYDKMGKSDDALAEYKSLIVKFPRSQYAEEAYFSIARIRAARGGTQNAVKAYEAYLNEYPMGQYRVMALFDIACLEKDAGNYDRAIAGYARIMKEFPNEPWFCSWSAIYTGHIYMKKNDYDRAVESYQRVISAGDNKFLYNLSLLHRGQAFIEKKDYKTAVSIFQMILKDNNYFAEEALYGMGKAHYKANEFDMAKESLQTLLQLFPQTVWKSDAQSRLKTIEKRIKAQREEEEKEAK